MKRKHRLARTLVLLAVAVPGTSEHQTGLAVDIASEDASAQVPDVVWRWLEKSAHRYGFIRRYSHESRGLSNHLYPDFFYFIAFVLIGSLIVMIKIKALILIKHNPTLIKNFT